MKSSLCNRHCQLSAPLLTEGERSLLLPEVQRWSVDERGHLVRTLEVPTFAVALELATRVGAIAEAENHHPELYVAWGRLRITTWTHSAGGLSENDFVLAARVDEMLEESAVAV